MDIFDTAIKTIILTVSS